MDNQVAGIAHNPQQEFWQRPSLDQAGVAAAPQLSPIRPAPDEVCSNCRAEFMAGAGFCHQCGLARNASAQTASVNDAPWVPVLSWLTGRLGLTGPSLGAFLVGIVCVCIAIVGGTAYSSQSYPDFPAIMLWRMQWLVGATAAFVAGILLKSQETRK